MTTRADDLKDWMDARGLSAAEVAKALGTEEQTVRKWRSQGVPDRRRPHVERYMAEWVDPKAATVPSEAETSVLRIEFDDAELDDVSKAAAIVETPLREFIRRAAIHKAREEMAKEARKMPSQDWESQSLSLSKVPKDPTPYRAIPQSLPPPESESNGTEGN